MRSELRCGNCGLVFLANDLYEIPESFHTENFGWQVRTRHVCPKCKTERLIEVVESTI